MKLSIFKQDARSSKTTPYVMTVSMKDEIIPPENNFHVPIYREDDPDGGESSYEVEICGFKLGAATPDELVAPAAKLLDGLINMARLPTYVFVASESLFIYPVYTIGDEVMATTPGGPVFRHVELAEVRSYLADYLHIMEELGTPGQTETLHVRGVHRDTLALMRPIYYLKKRVLGEVDFWAPVFRSEDGRTIYTYAASAKREVPIDTGHEVLDLQLLVSEALMADGRLNNLYDLRSDRLFPQEAQHLLETLTLQPYELRFKSNGNKVATTVPLYRNGKAYLAAEYRKMEDRYNIIIGSDPHDLMERVSLDLDRRGRISSSQDVELVEIV